MSEIRASFDENMIEVDENMIEVEQKVTKDDRKVTFGDRKVTFGDNKATKDDEVCGFVAKFDEKSMKKWLEEMKKWLDEMNLIGYSIKPYKKYWEMTNKPV